MIAAGQKGSFYAGSIAGRRLQALRALLRHWASHLGQFIALIAGLASATALFIGVQLLNAEARSSYTAAENSLTGSSFPYFKGIEGRSIPVETYVSLVRGGMRLTPVMEGRITLKPPKSLLDNSSVRLVGYDLFTLGPVANGLGFLPNLQESSQDTNLSPFSGRGVVFAAPETFKTIASDWAVKSDAAQGDWPDLQELQGVPKGYLYSDIAVADRLLARGGAIDRIILVDRSQQDLTQFPALKPFFDQLIVVDPAEQLDLGQMTESFHLNLTAFSLLSFLVGLFIVYSAMSLAYQDRLPLFRTLLTLGIGRRALIQALVIELVLLSVGSGLIGLITGFLLASVLMPGLALTINGLYGAALSGGLTFNPIWIAISLGSSLFGAGLSGLQLLLRVKAMPLLALRDGRLWQDKSLKNASKVLTFALGGFVVSCFCHFVFFTLTTAFIFMATFLIAAAFLLPTIVSGVLSWLADKPWPIRVKWFWSEARADAPRISLALMALLLALSAHFGVKTMVTGYRLTFVDFLEERLAPDIYVRTQTPEEGDALITAIGSDARFDRAIPIWGAASSYKGVPLGLTTFEDDPIYRDTWSLLSATEDVWTAPFAGRALLVSEQFARGEGLKVGESIKLETRSGEQAFRIVGVFADYGNTAYQARIARQQMVANFKLNQRTNYGLILADKSERGRTETITYLKTRFDLGDDEIIDQQALKNIALQVFNQTFKVSAALGLLTLTIASGALLASLLTLADHRLTQLAPLWGMGLRRRSLSIMEAGRTLALSLITAITAIPVGMGVAYILIDHINVAAFRWKLPFKLDLTAFSDLIMLAVLTSLLASLLPTRRLMAMPAAKLSKVFAHEG